MSKKGAALYNKIRNGGYGCQFTGTYSRNPVDRTCCLGSYTAEISSGRYRINYSLPKVKKSVQKKDKKKTLRQNSKKSKAAYSKNPWVKCCAENNISNKAVKAEVAKLYDVGDIKIIEKFYSADFEAKTSKLFEPQIWVLPNLAIIPNRNIVLNTISIINLVNCGTKSIFIEEKRGLTRTKSSSSNSLIIHPGERTIMKLSRGVCYEIGIGQTSLCQIIKQ